MPIWKRPEVFIFFIISAGIIGFVVWNQTQKSLGVGETENTSITASPITLEEIKLTRDYGNAQLDLIIALKNESDSDLTFLAPDTKLLDSEENPVEPFVLAFSQPKPLPVGKTGKRTLSYWLDESDLEGSLNLLIGKHMLEIKSAEPFSLDTLKNQNATLFSTANWTPTTPSEK